MGTLLHSCAEVRELIELSFMVISGVGPDIGVLDGGRCAARESGSFVGFYPPLVSLGFKFQWHIC